MAERDPQKQDLILPYGSYAYVLNDKGVIDTWLGAARIVFSSSQDQPVTWNADERRFEVPADPKAAIRHFILAREGQYVVLDNPAKPESKDQHPPKATSSRADELMLGSRTVIHGPASFALWPMQRAIVVPGHTLRSDQYLLAKVYDEQSARANIGKAVIKGAEDGRTIMAAVDLTTGRLFVIPGTMVNFYMPSPGVEVLQDVDGAYVRDAVTLEQLEYALLRDQSGEKRYVYGPDVVFPAPTETFAERKLDGGVTTRKFRMIELTATSGLYVKVVAPYIDADGEHAAGDELFITGDKQPIYRPRVEHMLIKQGTNEIHYSLAIPNEGTGYYVLNKTSWSEGWTDHKDGVVETIRGPRTLLIDPRRQVMTRRVLPTELVRLMYPANFAEVAAVNEARAAETQTVTGTSAGLMREVITAGLVNAPMGAVMSANASMRKSAARGFEGDVSMRPTSYEKPRAIDLDSSKYDGAVRMAIRPGYAVMLTDSSGGRRVVKDGEVALLAYDEVPVVLAFSTGTPKSGASRKKDVYLRMVTKISDEIQLETSDGVKMRIELSYRVRYEGEETSWFNVEDPSGFLTDNLRSRVHHAVSKIGIRSFYADAAGIIRDIVLGKASESAARPGLLFEENNSRVYDVDVVALAFADGNVAALFAQARRATFVNELALDAEQRSLAQTEQLLAVELKKARLDTEAARERSALKQTQVQVELEAEIAAILAEAAKSEERTKVQITQAKRAGEEDGLRLANERARSTQEQEMQANLDAQTIQMLAAQTKAHADRMAAITPGLVNALTMLGESEILGKLTENLSVQSIMGGESVVDVFKKAFAGTRFAEVLDRHDLTAPWRPSASGRTER